MSTTLEAKILAALKPGGMLTIATIALNAQIAEWEAKRAALELQRRDFAFENLRNEWQITPAGRRAATR